MGFDDLARHMAGRDNKKLSTATSVDQLVAEAAEADRRLTRQRNLILGPVLIVCGVTFGVLLYFFYASQAHALSRPDPRNDNTMYYSIGVEVLAVAMVIAGVRQTLRGLRAPQIG